MIRSFTAWALMMTGWVWLFADIVQLRITGLALAGVVLITTALWILGVFTRDFWVHNRQDTHK